MTYTKPHSRPALIIPGRMNRLDAQHAETIQGSKRREGSLAWKMGPGLFASAILGPAGFLLALF
ncbi:hypothetical protein JHJ32_21480 [Parapedobacter sp. ISTM3]|uniref:hypothetical protein n=1 Tax=Parapedobacter sp. ISTM3 TaxID=2800130 RepID=UPI0019074A0F|nr:hypothetical protein [Parapedobacter sp. ISTM3]MBK1442586.1 hypothetical protein [Parapedobacter sp. ISTM3]